MSVSFLSLMYCVFFLAFLFRIAQLHFAGSPILELHLNEVLVCTRERNLCANETSSGLTFSWTYFISTAFGDEREEMSHRRRAAGKERGLCVSRVSMSIDSVHVCSSSPIPGASGKRRRTAGKTRFASSLTCSAARRLFALPHLSPPILFFSFQIPDCLSRCETMPLLYSPVPLN